MIKIFVGTKEKGLNIGEKVKYRQKGTGISWKNKKIRTREVLQAVSTKHSLFQQKWDIFNQKKTNYW